MRGVMVGAVAGVAVLALSVGGCGVVEVEPVSDGEETGGTSEDGEPPEQLDEGPVEFTIKLTAMNPFVLALENNRSCMWVEGPRWTLTDSSDQVLGAGEIDTEDIVYVSGGQVDLEEVLGDDEAGPDDIFPSGECYSELDFEVPRVDFYVFSVDVFRPSTEPGERSVSKEMTFSLAEVEPADAELQLIVR